MKFAFVIVCFIVCAAAEHDPPNMVAKELVSSSEKILEVPPAFSFYDAGQCDARGHLFFQLDTDHSINNSSVLELDASANEPTLFKMPSTLSGKSYFINFSVSSSGRVWMLIGNVNKIEVLGFGSDGEASSKVIPEIPEHANIQKIAVTDGGSFLLSGFFDSQSAVERRGKPYVALFNNSGQLIKQLGLSLPNIALNDMGTKPYEGGISLGEDGNLYLLYADGVVVISQTGTVVRQFSIKKPAQEYSATNLVISGGYLSIWLQKVLGNGSVAYQFLLLDAHTGEPMALYKPAKELGNTPVCFSRQKGFTFYSIKNGRVKLDVASLR